MLSAMISLALKFVLIAISSIVVYNIFVAIKYFRHVKFSWHVKGFFLPCLPFVGNLYVALFTGTKVNLLGTLSWISSYFGMPCNIWYGYKYHYISNNAEETRIVLNHPKCYCKAQIYDDLRELFKSSILLVHADLWKPRRRHFRTAFRTNSINAFSSTFYNQSCLLNKRIKSESQPKDLYSFFNSYTFLNFYLTASGLDGSQVDPAIETFGALVDSVQDEFVKLLINPVVPGFIWINSPLGMKFKYLVGEVKRILGGLLQNEKKMCDDFSASVENTTQASLIDLLFSFNTKDINYDILEELTFLAGAATDTTGHSLAFCFTLLGMHPKVQERVYEEVMSVIGDHTIDHNNTQDLIYTEAVICETMRILPSVPYVGRYCEEDINLGTKILPKGANFVASTFHIHRNPLYWPEPTKFDPTRFSSENASKIVPGSYLPFSIGPRNCLGRGMAMLLLKITVANVIRQFRITSSHKSVKEFTLQSCISMKTTHPLDCRFHPRSEK